MAYGPFRSDWLVIAADHLHFQGQPKKWDKWDKDTTTDIFGGTNGTNLKRVCLGSN